MPQKRKPRSARPAARRRPSRAPARPRAARLHDLGLVVDRTIGDKIVGTIDGARLGDLRADPAVREVETSVRLHPHKPRA